MPADPHAQWHSARCARLAALRRRAHLLCQLYAHHESADDGRAVAQGALAAPDARVDEAPESAPVELQTAFQVIPVDPQDPAGTLPAMCCVWCTGCAGTTAHRLRTENCH